MKKMMMMKRLVWSDWPVETRTGRHGYSRQKQDEEEEDDDDDDDDDEEASLETRTGRHVSSRRRGEKRLVWRNCPVEARTGRHVCSRPTLKMKTKKTRKS